MRMRTLAAAVAALGMLVIVTACGTSSPVDAAQSMNPGEILANHQPGAQPTDGSCAQTR